MRLEQTTITRLVGWFVVALVALLLGGRAAWAQQPMPVATATVTSPLSEFIGESFTTQACFDNTGAATGYQPIFELITPAGVTFNSATYLDGAVSASPAQTCSNSTGCTFTNPDTNTPVIVADGETFRVLRYPLGSFTVEQPPQCMDLNFSLGNSPTVQLGVAKNLTVTPVFSLGADALDNPATDPPIFGSPQTIVVNPTVIQHEKTVSGEDVDIGNETATGPNYPRTVTLTVDVATGETVSAVTVTDTLPRQFQFIAVTNDAGCTPTATPSISVPGGALTLNCGSITGVAGVDRTITFTFYIPESDDASAPVLDATTPIRVPITNDSSVGATYQGNLLPPTTASDTISAKAVALQKGGAIVSDTAPASLTPGDTVEYTLNGQVSDYFTVGDLTVTDTLGDGQTFCEADPPTSNLTCDFTPTVALQSNGTTVAATVFLGSEFTVASKGTDGRTPITFRLSDAIARLISGSGGQLVGDNSGGLGQGPTTFTIRLRSTIDNAYSGPVTGTPTLSAGDTIGNQTGVTFRAPGGELVSDDSSSSLTIATPELTKARYALNGNTTLPSPFLVAAGDTVTYRLTTSLPVSSVENFTLTDYLPIPLFSVPATLTNGNLCGGGGTPTPPAENTWCYTSSDIISSTPPTVETTPALNRVIWSYDDRELPTAGGAIDILYTLRATAEPMADQLNLANLAIKSYRDSLSGQDQTVATTAQVTTRQPQLAIRKEITAVSRGTIAGTPTTGYDAEAQNLDAGDTVTYRVRITNTGSAPAYGIRVTDDAGTLTAFGSPNSCIALAATLGDGSTAVATSGSLFTTDPSAGLTVTPSLAGNGDGSVQPNEEIWITYTCTLAADATPRTTDIDNTAALRYYTNIDPANPEAKNFATNTNLLTRRAKLTTQGIQSITKAITVSSVPDSTPDNNINNGETLTFTITATLSEGTYTGFALTDNTTTIPSPTCSAPFSCSANVSASGGTVTVTGTTGSTAGTISYTYTTGPLSASGSNTASVSATNAPAQTANATWTLDNPDPAITKTVFNSSGANDAGDTVEIRLGWSNADANNPMFRCVVTDVLDPNVFDLTTVAEVTTPSGYTYGYSSATGTVTYTYTPPSATPNAPCSEVAAGGAVFSVRIRNNVVTGSYSNTATISAQTLPASQSGGASVTASATAPVPIGAPSVSGKTITGTSLADTTGSNVAIGEVVTYRLVFRMAEGVTNSIRLIDQLLTGTSTAQLVYIPDTARLSRSSASLSAANNPGGINTVAINTPVAVTPTLSGANLIIDLGNVTNGDADGSTAENYTLEVQFRVGNVAANTAGRNLQNRPQITYRPAGASADQAVNGSTVTARVVAPRVAVGKTVSPAASAGGDTVTYTLTVRNSATGANAAPAYDYAFGDTLPTDMTPTGTPTANVGATGATVVGPTFSGQTLSGAIDKLDPGETVTITYQAQLSATVPFGKMLVNSASANATSLPGSDDNERTGSGSGPNNLFAGASATVTTETVTMTKAIRNPRPFYAIGEEVEYELRLALPRGSATGMFVEDILPTGLIYVTDSAAITIVGGVTAPSAGPITPTSTNPLRFTLGAVSASSAGEVVIAYRARVDNISPNQDGESRTNSARVIYDNPNPNGVTPLVYTAPNPPTARIGEPNLEMTKTILAGAANAQAGSVVRWQFTVSNIGNTAARQVAINDVLPGNTATEDKLTIPASPNIAVTAVGGVSKETGGAVTASDFSVSDTIRARDTLSATGLVLEPGATLTVAFDTVVGVNAAAGESLDNRANADYNSLPSGGSGGRDATNGGDDDDNNGTLNNYLESASHALQIQSRVTIDKQVTPVIAAIGEIVTYQLRIDVIQGTTNSVVVTDVLPDGLEYTGHAISVGNIGMAFGNPNYNTNLGSGQTVSFNLGNILNPDNGSSDDDYVLVEILGRVRNIAPNQNGSIIANGEAAGSPVSVTYDGPTGPVTVDFDHDASTPGNQGIPFTVVEPVLGVTKTANPAAQALGDIVTYTLNVSHQPSSTADAYDVVLVDTIPVGLTYIADSVNPPPAFVSFDPGTRRLTLGYASLPLAEGARTITYQARVDVSATVGTPLNNSLAMNWTSQSGATGAPDNGRTGADGPGGALNDYATTASTPVTPTASAAIYAPKSVAIAVDNTLPAGVANPGDVLEYTIVLANTGSSTVNNVVFTDPIPANTTYVAGSATTTRGTAATTGTPVTGVGVAVGSMLSGDQVTIRFRVTINAGVASGVVIRNQGSVDSDETVPKPTDGDGNPNNGDQPTDIPVGGQPPLTGALYAEKTVAWTDTNSSGTVNAGDALRYTIVLRNRGATTLAGLSFSDTIPTGLTYVAASATASSGTPAVTGQAVSWTGIADLAPGASQTLRFDVTIGAITGASQTFVNQGTATSTQTGSVRTDGNGDPSDGAQPTSITAVGTGPATPALDVQKRWSLAVDGGTVGQVDPGDTVQYTITVANTGAQAATDVRLTDAPLPAQFTFVPGSLATSLGAVVTETPIEVNIGTLNPGQTATVTFQMTVNAGTGGQIASNQANATANGGISVDSDDNGNAADGRNPTLTPIGPVAPSGLSKSLVNTSVGNDTSSLVQIGEILTYRIQFNVPAGATGEVTMLDTLPAGMSYVASSARLARVFATGLTASQNPGGINSAASGINNAVSLADGTEASINGSTVSVFLGDVINSDSNSATTESYILELQARVDNVADNQTGTALNNQAGLSYRNAAGQLFNLSPVTQTATVAEPNLQIAKTADVNAVLANTASTVRFTLTLTNPAGANVSTGYDVTASDSLPAGFASATLVSAVPSGGVTGDSCSFTGTTLDCNAAVFPPGGQLVVTYDAVTTATLAEGSTLVNSAAARWTSLPGGDLGERTGDGGVDDYADASGVTIRVGTPALDKSIVDPQTRYAIGDEVTYRVVLSFPGTLTNVSFQDVLPEGLTYIVNSLTLSYGAGLSSSGNPADFTRTDNSPAAGQETLSLTFGTMTNGSGAVRTLTLTYRALVDNILGNQDGQTLPNAADLTYDQPGVGTPATVSDSETITVGEPRLAVTHTITSPTTNLDAGDAVTYRVTIENTGTTPSFETTLRDLLPPGLGNVQGISVVLTNTSGNSETPTITVLPDGWQSSPFDLQPGDVVTIVFTATLQNTVQPGQTLQARVDATYSSRDGAEDPNRRDGSTAGSDQGDDTALNNYNVEELSPTITVGDPVALSKAFHPNPARTTYSVGETVTYRLTVALSQGSINGVTITDTLPAGLTYLDATVGSGNTGIATGYGGSPAQSGQTLTFALGNVVNPANGSTTDDFITIDIRARVDNVAPNQNGVVLGNAAQLGFTDGAGTPQTRDFDADARTPGNQPLELTVVEPNLALDKAATPTQPSLGDEVTFMLTLDHTAASTADAFDLVATDNLPAGLSYVAGSASLAPSSVSPDGRTLTWTIASLTRATDNLTITYRARVSPGAVVGLGLTNTAALRYASTPGATGAADSGRTGAGGPNDYAATDAATVAPTASAVIAAQKTVAISTDANRNGRADPGDTLQYAATLTNTGSDAVSNVVFTDPIPANTEYVAGSATLNGSPSGSFANDTLTVNVGTLNPGASATIAFRVQINPGTPNGIIISNQGVVDSDQTVPTPTDADGDPSNGAQPTTTPVGGQPSNGALRAEKRVALLTDTAPTGVVSSGDVLRYTIVLSNTGTATLAGLTLSDPIPSGLSYVAGSANPAATLAGTTLTWSNLSVPAGGSLTLRFDVTVDPFTETERVFNNVGTVSSPQGGSVSTDGNGDPSDGAQPTVIAAANGSGAPRLDLQKRWTLAGNAAGDRAVNPGDILLYTLIVSNVGSAVASDVRVVDDPLPPQVTLISGSVLTSRGGVVSENPLTVNVGNLNPGELATISFRVSVNANTGGQNASNQAAATAANDPGGVISDNDGDPANGRNPTLTPILGVVDIPTLSPVAMLALLGLLLSLGWRYMGQTARRRMRG